MIKLFEKIFPEKTPDLKDGDSFTWKENYIFPEEPKVTAIRPSGSSVYPLSIDLDATQIALPFLSSGSYPLGTISAGEPIHVPPSSLMVDDDIIEKLWEKMYSQPVLVRCPHCDSVNVITSPTCVQCGAPMGTAKRIMSKR